MRSLSLSDRSIGTRLVLTVCAAVSVAMLGVGVLHGWWATHDRFLEIRSDRQGVAKTLAAILAPAQASGRFLDVQKALRTTTDIPNVRFARVTGPSGVVIASHGNSSAAAGDADIPSGGPVPGLATLVSAKSMDIQTPIAHAGRSVGTLNLRVDIAVLAATFWKAIGLAIVAAIAAGSLACILTTRLSRKITGPILKLIGALREVRNSYDFSRRVTPIPDDETGDLTQAFNDFLHEIRQRDILLARHRESLERIIAERRRDVRIAECARDAAEARQNSLLATLRQEIGTPLAVLASLANQLCDARLAQRYRSSASSIVAAAKAVEGVMDDVVDFANIEAGRVELNLEPVALRELVDGVTGLFAPEAVAKGIDIAAHVAADVPRQVSADHKRLAQILTSLMNNAMRQTSRGGIRLSVTAEHGFDAAERAYIGFAVTDTGPGIPHGRLEKLFDVPTAMSPRAASKVGGGEFGLSVCSRLAEAMGGRIEAASTFGKGATLTLNASFEIVQPAPNGGAVRVAADANSVSPVIVLNLPAGATRSVLAAYARQQGYHPVLVEEEDAPRRVMEQAFAVIAASAHPQTDKHAANDNAFRIALRDFPLSTDALEALGSAETSISPDGTIGWPLRCAEVALMFACLRRGNLSPLKRAHNLLVPPLIELRTTPALAPEDAARLAAAPGNTTTAPDCKSAPDGVASKPASRTPVQAPLLDAAVLHAISTTCIENVDLVGRVVTLYREHAPAALKSLGFNWDTQSDTAVAQAAHALKSLSRNVGAVRVAELCESIESEARATGLKRGKKRLGELEAALCETLAVLPGGSAGKSSSRPTSGTPA